MESRRHSTRDERIADRPEVWRGIVRPYFGDLRVDALSEGPLDAELDVYQVGPLQLYRLSAPPHRVRRNSPRDELPYDAAYKLVLLLQGRTEVSVGSHTVMLRPGDWSLYDPHAPYAITSHEPTVKLVAQVPRALLAGHRPPKLHTCEAHTSNLLGLSALFGSFLRCLAEQLPELPNGVGQSVSETVVGLLTSTLAASQAEQAEHASLPGVMKLRVKQYVAAHLGDPELSIDRIARDLRCSKRYLHKVFADEGESLERHIWNTRLAHCESALHDSRRPISEIAFTCGFTSAAHFSRMFKDRFGVAPTDYRAQRHH